MIQSGQRTGLVLKILITWLCIFLVVGFLIATRAAESPVTLSVLPEVPRTGEPVVATFNIANPSDVALTTSYQLYANGRLVGSGQTTNAPQASAKYQYAYRNSLERGEQVNFVLRTSSQSRHFDRAVSLPAYPPQLMSSFVSFAAFSTSVMSSLISMEYFKDAFGITSGFNTGIIITLVLLALLIFLELTRVVVGNGTSITLVGHQIGFSTLSAILFIIFVGMVFTRVVMIIRAFG